MTMQTTIQTPDAPVAVLPGVLIFRVFRNASPDYRKPSEEQKTIPAYEDGIVAAAGERLGTLQNVQLTARRGMATMRADLHLSKNHPLAEKVIETLSADPDAFQLTRLADLSNKPRPWGTIQDGNGRARTVTIQPSEQYRNGQRISEQTSELTGPRTQFEIAEHYSFLD